MKKKFSMIAVLSMLILAACKKDNHEPASQSTRVATIRQTVLNASPLNLSKFLAYDAENRLEEIKFTTSSNNSAMEKYTYAGNLVQYRYTTNGTEVEAQSIDFTLNNGRAETWTYPYLNKTVSYEFNNAGYITRYEYKTNGTSTGYAINYYNNNHVLDSLVGFGTTGIKSYSIEYTYEVGKKNTIGNESKGLKMLGKDQVAPVSSKILYNYSNGTSRKAAKNDYTYVYDSNGRITKLTNRQTNYTNEIPAQQYIAEEFEYTYK